jgi:hypothetical protein
MPVMQSLHSLWVDCSRSYARGNTDNGFGPRIATALASAHLPQLEYLYLSGCAFGARGLAILAEATVLSRELDVTIFGERDDVEGRDALAARFPRLYI